MTQPPVPRRRKRDRPPEILAAALALFAEKGFAATRMEDVAARAGISKGTVFLYFPSKEELFRAVVRHDLLPVLAAAEVLVATHQGSAAELLRLLAGRLGAVLATDLAAIPKLVLAESGNFPSIAQFYAEEVVQRGVALMESVLGRGMASGEFRQLPPRAVLPSLFGPLLMLALWRFSLGRHSQAVSFDPEEVMATHLDLILRGLKP
jgi:AcrR family transcriptional regulator